MSSQTALRTRKDSTVPRLGVNIAGWRRLNDTGSAGAVYILCGGRYVPASVLRV